jgi:hypothetical protein
LIRALYTYTTKPVVVLIDGRKLNKIVYIVGRQSLERLSCGFGSFGWRKGLVGRDADVRRSLELESLARLIEFMEGGEVEKFLVFG